MRIRVGSRGLAEMKVDVAVCFAKEGDKHPLGVTERALANRLSGWMSKDGFKAHTGDRLVVCDLGSSGPRRLLVLGIGKAEGSMAEALRMGAARAVRAAADLRAASVGLLLPTEKQGAGTEAIRAATEGLLFGNYRFEGYMTDADRKQPAVGSAEISTAVRGAKGAVQQGQAGARAVYLARDLVNEPPSDLNPDGFVKRARAEVRRAGLTCKVLQESDLKKHGMRALLAVARGSTAKPKVLHLSYKPSRRSKKAAAHRILLVGKGVTFDSGGLDLKPAEYMTTMKCDMGGAAAVLATMTALKDLGCPVEVHALMGLTENMTGGAAYKPGDILKTRSGKTVEIGNTDAEGRLVLCDVLDYGIEKIRPTEVVDVATLTGACVVALGPRATGVFTRHDGLRQQLLDAAERGGEKFWPLPMYDEYLAMLQRGPADLNNVGSRYGGAITAALFLGEFVPRDLSWAHLDIAGPAFTEKDLPDAVAGGTGAGALALIRWLESRA